MVGVFTVWTKGCKPVQEQGGLPRLASFVLSLTPEECPGFSEFLARSGCNGFSGFRVDREAAEEPEFPARGGYCVRLQR